jgi:hypothetical protein
VHLLDNIKKTLNVWERVRCSLHKSGARQTETWNFVTSLKTFCVIRNTYCIDMNGNLLKLETVFIKLAHSFNLLPVSYNYLFHFSVLISSLHVQGTFCLKRVITYPAILTYLSVLVFKSASPKNNKKEWTSRPLGPAKETALFRVVNFQPWLE